MYFNSLEYFCCPGCKGMLQLTTKKRTDTEALEGTLHCVKCAGRFEITNGLANLMFPSTLKEPDLASQTWYDQRPEYDGRFAAFRFGIWEYAFGETRARWQVIRKLEARKGASILETGTGNGGNLPIIADLVGPNGRLDGLDISVESLMVARKRMISRGIQVELIQGNASYLPYGTGKYDAVLHIGAMNALAEPKEAIQEMHRVAKPGAKIVICDEGLAPGREKTILGRWLLKCAPGVFTGKPPVELLPNDIEDLYVYWVWQGTHWVIEFRKIR